LKAFEQDGAVRLATSTNDRHFIELAYTEGEKLRFKKAGLISDEYWPDFEKISFSRLGVGEYPDITDFRQDGSEYNKFNKSGRLQELPPEIPSSLINVAAYLFRDDAHTLFPLLKHPSLKPETLAFLAEHLFGKEHPDDKLARIASHPNASRSTLNYLFAKPNAALVWHAVAQNPTTRGELYEAYIDKVKGDLKSYVKAVNDPDCPPDLLVWIYDQTKDRFLRNNILSKKNTPTFKLEEAFQLTPYEDVRRSLANNPTIPDSLMQKVIQTDAKKVLWAAQKNPNISTQALDIVLWKLATHSEVSVHDTAIRDSRISESLAELLLNEIDQRNRMMLARNPSLSEKQLVALANDDYQVVSAEARKQLSKRYPKEAPIILKGLPELSELNPARDKRDEIELAVKNGDIEVIKKCGTYFLENDALQPSYHKTFLESLRMDDPRIMETLLPFFPSFHPNIFINDEAMNKQWIDFFHERGAFETQQYQTLKDCLSKSNWETMDYLLKKGFDINEKDKSGITLLMYALNTRNLDSIEQLLRLGADPSIKDNKGMDVLDYAAKAYLMHIVKRLDDTNRYRDLVDSFAFEFPPSEESPLLGTWSNKRDGFKTSVLMFSNDGTGVLSSSVMSYLVGWKPLDESTVELVQIGRHGPEMDKRMTIQYRLAKDILHVTEWNGESVKKK